MPHFPGSPVIGPTLLQRFRAEGSRTDEVITALRTEKDPGQKDPGQEAVKN